MKSESPHVKLRNGEDDVCVATVTLGLSRPGTTGDPAGPPACSWPLGVNAESAQTVATEWHPGLWATIRDTPIGTGVAPNGGPSATGRNADATTANWRHA